MHTKYNKWGTKENTLAILHIMQKNAHYKVDTHFSYLLMATTHLHRPSAAVDAFLTLAGSKSGLVAYSLRILVM